MILPKNSFWQLHHFIMSVMQYKNIVVVSKHIKTGQSRAIKNILWISAAVVGVNSMGLCQNKKDCEKEIRAERVPFWLLMEDKNVGGCVDKMLMGWNYLYGVGRGMFNQVDLDLFRAKMWVRGLYSVYITKFFNSNTRMGTLKSILIQKRGLHG